MRDFDNLMEESITIEGVELPASSAEYLADYYEMLGTGSRELIGVRTGLDVLDKTTYGLDGLVVLGGIAGKGKTSLALQLSFGACEKGTPVLFYSLEMPRRAIFTRLFSRLANISYADILLKGGLYLNDGRDTDGVFSEENNVSKLFKLEEIQRIKKAKEQIETVGNLFYVRDNSDKTAISTTQIEKEIRMLIAEHEAEKVLVVIDHLQIFKSDGYTDLKDKIDKLMADFKKINEKTGACILLISQKNRTGYYSKGLESLMGSAGIEYTADMVMLLDSKEEKDNRAKGVNYFEDSSVKACGDKEPIDLSIVKNRYNTPSTITLDFCGKYSYFTPRKER